MVYAQKSTLISFQRKQSGCCTSVREPAYAVRLHCLMNLLGRWVTAKMCLKSPCHIDRAFQQHSM